MAALIGKLLASLATASSEAAMAMSILAFSTSRATFGRLAARPRLACLAELGDKKKSHADQEQNAEKQIVQCRGRGPGLPMTRNPSALF